MTDSIDTIEETSLPDSLTVTLPERTLWSHVLLDAIHAAMRGDERACWWIDEQRGAFEQICGFLDLPCVEIRQRIAARNVLIRATHRNQYSGKRAVSRLEPIIEPATMPNAGWITAPGQITNAPRKKANAVPQCPGEQPQRPWPALRPAPESAVEPVGADPVPVLEWIALPERTRKGRI
jgi:hypothetical protein